MKRIIISVVILLLLAVMCTWSVFAVKCKTDTLNDMIEQVEKAFESGDSEKCVKAASALEEEWQDFMSRAILVNDLGHAIEITSSIAEIYSFAQEQNEELYAACDRAEAQIAIFEKMQIPTLWKIL